MSLSITGPNGPAIIGVSGCTLLLPDTQEQAIIVSAAHPPTVNGTAGTRTMTIDFHGDCCSPMGCENCGCHACIMFSLVLNDQTPSNPIPALNATREQNIPCRKIAPPAMPDHNRLLFSLTVSAPIHFGKDYSLYVEYRSGTCANPSNAGYARMLPFWTPGA